MARAVHANRAPPGANREMQERQGNLNHHSGLKEFVKRVRFPSDIWR